MNIWVLSTVMHSAARDKSWKLGWPLVKEIFLFLESHSLSIPLLYFKLKWGQDKSARPKGHFKAAGGGGKFRDTAGRGGCQRHLGGGAGWNGKVENTLRGGGWGGPPTPLGPIL